MIFGWTSTIVLSPCLGYCLHSIQREQRNSQNFVLHPVFSTMYIPRNIWLAVTYTNHGESDIGEYILLQLRCIEMLWASLFSSYVWLFYILSLLWPVYFKIFSSCVFSYSTYCLYPMVLISFILHYYPNYYYSRVALFLSYVLSLTLYVSFSRKALSLLMYLFHSSHYLQFCYLLRFYRTAPHFFIGSSTSICLVKFRLQYID